MSGGRPGSAGRRPRDDGGGDPRDADDQAGGRRPRSANVIRGDQQLMESLKRSSNTCPICKMPLITNDTGASDKLWQTVQFCFKGKPSFTLDDLPGTNGPRNRTAFGVVHPIGGRGRSIQKCHYVDESVLTGTRTHLWNRFDQPSDIDSDITFIHFPLEGRTKTIPFSQELNATHSIFKHITTTQVDMLDDLVWRVHTTTAGATERVNVGRMNRAVTNIVLSTFTGCTDCNQKMTQMEMIPALFHESFKSTREGDPWIQADHHSTAMMYYLLLQGLLNNTNVLDRDGRQYIDPNGMQTIRIAPNQQEQWKMKLAVMWCLLKIFLSNRSISSMNLHAAHHTTYIYSGTSDFYLSLLLYIVYIANIPGSSDIAASRTNRDPLLFEEFHHFYTTNFPFFLRATQTLLQRNARESFSNSLTTAIYNANKNQWQEAPPGLGLAPSINARDIHSAATEFIGTFHRRLRHFIRTKFMSFCDDLYTSNDPIGNYFPSYPRVQQLVHHATQLHSDTCGIQQFTDILTPAMYWYPFKHITMAQISAALKFTRIYYTPNGAAVIDNWARHAFAAVHALRCASSELTSIRRLASASPASGPSAPWCLRRPHF